ncbi:30S ribosomal protein S6 domain protein [Cooperia oncophora]
MKSRKEGRGITKAGRWTSRLHRTHLPHFDAILKEFGTNLNSKDEKIRHLEYQLQSYEESNVRMAEVVSDLASNENKVVRSAGAHLTNVAQVQTMSPMAKVCLILRTIYRGPFMLLYFTGEISRCSNGFNSNFLGSDGM